MCFESQLRWGGALPARASGLVDSGCDAAALGWAAGGELRPLSSWATGVVRVAVAKLRQGSGVASLRLLSG
jgi:hypothetical protein